MMTLLLRAGYWTHGVGKMHFRGRSYGYRNLLTMEEGVAHRVDDDYLRYPRDAGVQARFPKGRRDLLYFQPQTSGVPVEHSASNWVADRSVEFLREHARYRPEQPFFLWSSWIAPHPPFAPSEPYDELYDPAAMPLPEYADRPVDDLPSALWPHRARLDGAHRDPDRMRRIRALYYGLVGQVDDGIARIMAALRELGLEEDTVVLFTADHGEMLGDHGLSQKNCPYEPSVRVPLLLRWPGRTGAGAVCEDPVGLTDVLPTLVDELGLDYPAGHGPLPGESLLGKRGGGLASGRGDYVIDYGQGARRWIAVRTRRHKYALFACDGGRQELYDLHADPHERSNLSAAQPELTAAFRERVLEWERELAQLVVGVAHQAVVGGPGAADLPVGVAAEAERPAQPPRRRRLRVQVPVRQVRQVGVVREVQREERLRHHEREVGGDQANAQGEGALGVPVRPLAQKCQRRRHRRVVGFDLRGASRPGGRGGRVLPLELRLLAVRARRYAGGGPHHPGPGLARLRYPSLPREDRVLQLAVQVARRLLPEAVQDRRRSGAPYPTGPRRSPVHATDVAK